MFFQTMEHFFETCPLDTIPKEKLVFQKCISYGSNSHSRVLRGTYNNTPCIAKEYVIEEWDESSLSETLEDCSALTLRFKREECRHFMYPLGYCKTEKYIYLVYEDTNSQGLYSYIESDKFWEKVEDGETGMYTYQNGTILWNYLMKTSEKYEIIQQMILCVQELHSMDLIHLDIKTDNFVIQEKTKHVHLIDYDTIHPFNGERIKLKQRLGTLGYRSLEHESLSAGKEDDIYSLGVSMVEVWTGEIWEEGESFKSCRNEVLKRIREIEKNDPKVGKLFRDCVSLRSKKRPTINQIYERIK